jgi:hypothetical protein
LVGVEALAVLQQVVEQQRVALPEVVALVARWRLQDLGFY